LPGISWAEESSLEISIADLISLKRISKTLGTIFGELSIPLASYEKYIAELGKLNRDLKKSNEDLQKYIADLELKLTSALARSESSTQSLDELKADLPRMLREAERQGYWKGFRDGAITAGIGGAALGAGAAWIIKP
jgi:chromosome segregation ATPase